MSSGYGIRALLSVILMTQCASCTKYGLLIPEEAPDPLQKPSIQVSEAFPVVTEKIRQYLKEREKLESIFVPASSGEEIRFTQPWVRDSSLRYYVLEFDRRERHVVEWKAQWIISSRGPLLTEIRLEVLEVMFMGPPRRAGPGPTLNNQWFELEQDPLRANLELRRFWKQSYPNSALPSTLANIKVPSLKAEPLGKMLFEPHWPIYQRRRAF